MTGLCVEVPAYAESKARSAPTTLDAGTGLSADDPLGEKWAASPPELPPSDAPIFPVSSVKPGMRVVGWTVFEGDQVKPFTGTVKGVAESMMAPQRDIVVVNFEQPLMRHVGIVHGMSGSPVYINGRLLGALSLALSPFPKDALGGVTPISYMLDEAKAPGSAPGFTLSPSYQRSEPLLASGVEPEVISHYAPQLSAQGWDMKVGSPLGRSAAQPVAGGVSTGPLHHAATPEEQKAAEARLQPGTAVAGVLVEGDVNLVVTGTVTWRKGDDVLAFGHPFMQQGPMSIPMATADVIATVADQTYPYKLANLGVTVGTMTGDRVTAVVGTMGTAPKLIPVSVKISQEGQPTSAYQYAMIPQRELAPTLFQILVANSIRKQWRYFDEGTYEVTARFVLEDGRSIDLSRGYTFSHAPAGGNVFDVVDELSKPFSALVANPFKTVKIERVEVAVAAVQTSRLMSLSNVAVPASRVHAGERLPIQIALRQYLGPDVLKSLDVPIPGGFTGTLTMRIADAETMERKSPVGGEMEPSRATDLDQLVGLLNQGRRADRVYVQLVRKAPGLALRHQQLTALPGSVTKVLELASSSEVVSRLDQTVVWEGSVPLDGVLLGSQEYELTVLPPR